MLGSSGWMGEDLFSLLEILKSGKLKPVIDRKFRLSEANEALALIEGRQVFCRVLVHPK